MGREIIKQKEFTQNKDWAAIRAAEKYVTELGYDFGSLDVPNPVALVKGDYTSHQLRLPHKWHNFTPFQKRNIDGVITGSFRNGPVKVTIYDSYFN